MAGLGRSLSESAMRGVFDGFPGYNTTSMPGAWGIGGRWSQYYARRKPPSLCSLRGTLGRGFFLAKILDVAWSVVFLTWESGNLAGCREKKVTFWILLNWFRAGFSLITSALFIVYPELMSLPYRVENFRLFPYLNIYLKSTFQRPRFLFYELFNYHLKSWNRILTWIMVSHRNRPRSNEFLVFTATYYSRATMLNLPQGTASRSIWTPCWIYELEGDSMVLWWAHDSLGDIKWPR